MDVSDKKQRLCITQLGDDVLSLIYRRLNEVCDQESFRLTCHRFLDIVILVSCKCLDVTSSTKYRKSHNLDSTVLFRYRNCFRYRELASSISVLNLSSISVLDLSGCAVTDIGLEMITFYCNKSLISVILRGCPNITNTGILFLKQNCPQLRLLKLQGCENVVGVTSKEGFPSTLTYLDADAHALHPTGLLSGDGLEYLIVFNLRKNLNMSKNMNEAGLAAIGSGIARNLKILCFGFDSYVTDDCITNISKGCPFLQELILVYCKGIGLPGWVSIGLHCQNLEKLHVNLSNNVR
ncbi:F-box/LRR-repeat protein 12-like [Rutidosis leptorrhynchoides]|uniref:F-box/LRR-repeat protein 12-like n=1 Tax=Rutidosis leptorrhynchoides TaxID=125765 RepID=UPI003A9A1E8B